MRDGDAGDLRRAGRSTCAVDSATRRPAPSAAPSPSSRTSARQRAGHRRGRGRRSVQVVVDEDDEPAPGTAGWVAVRPRADAAVRRRRARNCWTPVAADGMTVRAVAAAARRPTARRRRTCELPFEVPPGTRSVSVSLLALRPPARLLDLGLLGRGRLARLVRRRAAAFHGRPLRRRRPATCLVSWSPASGRSCSGCTGCPVEGVPVTVHRSLDDPSAPLDPEPPGPPVPERPPRRVVARRCRADLAGRRLPCPHRCTPTARCRWPGWPLSAWRRGWTSSPSPTTTRSATTLRCRRRVRRTGSPCCPARR